MIKLTCSIFMISNNFDIIIFTYIDIKMSKDSSAEFYQNNKERLQRQFVKDIKVFLKKKKKSDNMVVNDTKIYQQMNNKSLLSIKKYYEMRKNKKLFF